MKQFLLLLLLIIPLHCKAPERKWMYVERGQNMSLYGNLIDAVVRVESNNGKYVYNPVEGAVGPFQIRQCRVDDYNHRTGENIVLCDCFDYDVSRRIFLYYCDSRDLEKIAKAWNGSGKKTAEYWRKVKSHLN